MKHVIALVIGLSLAGATSAAAQSSGCFVPEFRLESIDHCSTSKITCFTGKDLNLTSYGIPVGVLCNQIKDDEAWRQQATKALLDGQTLAEELQAGWDRCLQGWEGAIDQWQGERSRLFRKISLLKRRLRSRRSR